MQLFNVRYGLATNSSSSHSLIFKEGMTDRGVGGEFGWDNFVLASPLAKRHYAALTLMYSLCSDGMDFEKARLIIIDWTSVDISKSDYIDHQSVMRLPCTYNTNSTDHEFFNAFQAFLLKNNLAILGGNDNEESRWKPEGDFELPLPTDLSYRYVCRRDRDYWSIFSPETGSKIRFSFNDLTVKPTKATMPELVDIKITDFCPFDCPYCYQGSTISGTHAEREYVERLLYTLSEGKVFEVAIGGGEPTLHPEFVSFLRYARNYGIAPNFTTRNLSWLRDEERRSEILKYAGAFAVSVDNSDQVKKLDALLTTYGVDNNRTNLHIVMGTTGKTNLRDMLKVANERNLRVTLLGWKNTHRGSTYKMLDYSWWLDAVIEMIKAHKCPSLSIDTVLAAQSVGKLKAAGIPDYSYHIEDGTFSAYVDAVAKKLGPSSYSGNEVMVDLPLKSRDDLTEFRHIFGGF
jgi:hypothetical protein